MWKLAAIASFSVLAVVLVGAVLIIGVMVHRRKSHRRPLRGETHTGARVADTAPTRTTTKGSNQAFEATFGQESVKFQTGGAVSVEISSEVEKSFKDHVPGPRCRSSCSLFCSGSVQVLQLCLGLFSGSCVCFLLYSSSLVATVPPLQTFVSFLSSEPIEETAGPLYHA